MATRRAIANGNWSATGTWNGGVVPGNGDTVYANGFNVTLDQDITIGGENNPTVSAGSFVSGQWYEITFVGTTSWTGIGAASNTAGTVFLATGVGSGTGEAKALATLTTTNNTSAGSAAGGSFVMSTVRAMTCDLRAGTTTCLNVTATTGTLTLSGIRAFTGTVAGAHALNNFSTAALSGSNLSIFGGPANASAIFNNSNGSVSIFESVINSGTGGSGSAIFNNGTNTITLTNCAISGIGGAGGVWAITNGSTGSLSISGGTIIGGLNSAAGVNNASTGSVSITNVTATAGNSMNGFAINNASTGNLTVTNSTFTASAFANAVNIANTSADVRLSGDFLDHWSGWKAVSGGKWRLGTTPSAARTRYALAGTTDSYVEMFTADNATFGQPAISDVRSGTVYGGGILTGTCAVPASGSVALGVPVDNTTGTAVLTEANVQAAVWGAAASSLTTAGSIGERLKNSATVATTGEQLATALTAP